MSNEITRLGAPYDNYAFEALCLEMSIWGTAEAALCAVFWRKAEAERNATTAGEIIRLQALLDTANMTIAGQAAELESIGAGGVSALLPAAATHLIPGQAHIMPPRFEQGVCPERRT